MEDPAMRHFALLLGVALSLLTSSAFAQNCDGFTDVLASSQFCPDVTWLKTYGVTKGCAPSQFCPNENVTRLQMAAFMHRLGNNPAFVNGGNAFGTTAGLGTTDAQSLELHVANARALRIEPPGYAGYLTPNIIGGSPVNTVAAGMSGATIAGGGSDVSFCGPSGTSPCGNAVTYHFGTVGGGWGNTADSFSTVAGGQNNTASGAGGTVPGGANNIASGTLSFAAGFGANADQDRCFVFANWSFQPGSNLSCGGFSNIARFGLDRGLSVDYHAARNDGGGTRFVAIGDTSAGNTINAWNGAVLTDGGAWTNASDRALKADFTAVDAQAVLAKVAQLHIDEWSYKTESGQRHLGPVAQDFYAAFGLGADNKHITTVDEGGVALAAIKGLNAKVEGQQREIAELRDRMQKAEALAADVVALKAALAELQRERQTVAIK
jgi:hypothetical protein